MAVEPANNTQIETLQSQIAELTASVKQLQSVIEALPSQHTAAKEVAPASGSVPVPLSTLDGVNEIRVHSSATPSGRSFAVRLCNGDANCWQNALCAPFVLPWNAISLYLVPCMKISLISALETILFSLFHAICCACCLQYRDKKFPPSSVSIGAWKGIKDPAEIDEKVKWRRATEFFTEQLTEKEKAQGASVKLFEHGISPRDLAQGQVITHCWHHWPSHPTLNCSFLTPKASPCLYLLALRLPGRRLLADRCVGLCG